MGKSYHFNHSKHKINSYRAYVYIPEDLLTFGLDSLTNSSTLNPDTNHLSTFNFFVKGKRISSSPSHSGRLELWLGLLKNSNI
jgi:hypothetical protein